MSIFDFIDSAKKSFQDILKTIQFKKSVSEREREVALLSARQKCCGVLSRSQSEYKRIIGEQLYHIQIGRSQNQVTAVQENLLGNAVLGYILMDDAQYAINSYKTVESLHYANALLNYAATMVSGKDKHPIKSRITDFKATHSVFRDQVSENAFHERSVKADEITKLLLSQGGDIDQYVHMTIPKQNEQQMADNSLMVSGHAVVKSDHSGTAGAGLSAEAANAIAFLNSQPGTGAPKTIKLSELSTSITPPPIQSDAAKQS